jgi:hypothetical protein
MYGLDFVFMVEAQLCGKTCYADGDANNDGIPLNISDLTYLIDFIHSTGAAPVPLYSCDLNGDGYVNTADIQVFQDYMAYGMSVFTPFGGYPVPCWCDPLAEPVPDTVNIFGMEHVSLGTACLIEDAGTLVVSRFTEEDTETLIDASGNAIVVRQPPPDKGAGSSGGPYGSSMSNLEDAGIVWQADYAEDTTLVPGASMEMDFIAISLEDSVDIVCCAVQTLQDDTTWALGVDAITPAYTVEAYLGDSLVWSAMDIPASGWFHVGNVTEYTAKAASSGGGPFGSSVSNLEDAGIVAIGWEHEDSLVWSWDSQGVSGMLIDRLSVSYERSGERMTLVSIGAHNMSSYTITGASKTVAYEGLPISNCGNAIVTVEDTTLVVSNIGPSGQDGIDAEADKDDGQWSMVEIVLENPDHDGTFPIGAGFSVGFEYAVADGPDFPAESFFDYAGANSWYLGFESTIELMSVEAYYNGSLVASVDSVPVGDLGYIIEAAKGVYPVGYKGTSTNKPAGIISVEEAEWSWDAQDIYEIMIDEIHVFVEVDVPTLGISKASIRGTNGDKGDPITVKVLDIQTVLFSCCQLRGDIDHNGIGPDIVDLIYLVTFMFQNGPEAPCMEETDIDGNGTLVPDISDLIYLVTYMFQGGPDLIPCGQSAPKLISSAAPETVELSVNITDDVTEVFLNAPIDLMGLQLELRGDYAGDPELLLNEPLEMIFGHDGQILRMGVLDMRGAGSIGSGRQAVVRIPGRYEVVRAVVADRQSRAIEVVVATAARLGALPDQFRLSQNYPNPFNPTTQIEFSLPTAGPARLVVYNITGQAVTTLVDEELAAGAHTTTWDASSVASGVYFYRLTTDGHAESRKMMLLK